MKICKTRNVDELSHRAAAIVSAQIILKPQSVLGLATGSTPLGIYKRLIEGYKNGDLDFSAVKTVNLDEYKGLKRSDSQSYYYYMQTNFFEHVNIPVENINIPDSSAKDDKEECDRYDRVIRELCGIDLQILGIGENGHIGFNEPGEFFISDTHCVALAKKTIEVNSRFFDSIDDVPTQAYTMGIKPIMQAKKIVLVASGKQKADAIYKCICGPITPAVPASILQLHGDVTIVADCDALSKVEI